MHRSDGADTGDAERRFPVSPIDVQTMVINLPSDGRAGKMSAESVPRELRCSRFVEGTAPIFSRPVLHACAPTFNESPSG